MKTINHQQLHRLLESQGGPHVSIFIPAPSETLNAKHESLRLRQLQDRARDSLVQHWMRENDADAFLRPLEELASDDRFLTGRRCGVAIYQSEGMSETFRVDDLDEEKCVVGRAFHTRPIAGQLDKAQFHVLTLSQNRIALLSSDGETLTEESVSGMPKTFASEAAETTADRGSQVHSSGQGVGKQAGVYHGQGGHADTEKKELREYLRRVDHAVGEHLSDREGLLILAGVEYLTSIYRELSTFPRLAESTIAGNVDHDAEEVLVDKVAAVIADEVDRGRQALIHQIVEPVQRPVATDPEQVLSSACRGQVENLLFARSGELYGSFDTETNALVQTRQAPSGDPGDSNHDLIELAIVETLRHRGAVTQVDDGALPSGALLAASLRY